jgi:O-antigen ligase
MPNRIKVLIKILIATTFFIPLVVLPSSYIFPFIVPKILLFRSVSLLMLGGYILLLFSNWQEYKMRLTPLNLAVGLFFISFGVSTFVGVDWYHSFWDNHERMLGLFTMFHFIAYYCIVGSVVKEWKEWRSLLRIFLLAGSLVMFIGFLQKINPDLLLNRGADRVSATLGNAIYFSGYGMFLFFIGLLLFLKEEVAGWKYFAATGGVLGFLGIFWGGTRGTLLGLGVSLLVFGLSYIATFKGNKKFRNAVALILVAGVLFSASLVIFRQNSFVKNIPGVNRLVSTDFTIKNSKVPRVMAWGIAIDAWKERPVFGWGPNNFYFAFNKYYRPEFLESGWGETWFDNAHNIVMNTLAVQGTAGIIIYFGLFSAVFYSLILAYRKRTIDQHLLAVGLAFAVGHFVHNITVFEDPTSYLYFFFFLAMLNQLTINKDFTLNSSAAPLADKKQRAPGRNISAGLAVFAGLFVLLLIYSTNINPSRANQKTLDSIKAMYTNPSEAIRLYKEAVAIASPHVDDIRNDFTRVAVQKISELAQGNKDIDLAQELFQLSYDESKKNLLLHPLDIRVNLQLVQVNF